VSKWKILFHEVRTRVRSAEPWTEGLRQAVAFARANPTLFDAAGYWSQVETHDIRNAMASVMNWAQEGLEGLAPQDGWSPSQHKSWEVVLLDLGDCPELFRFYSPGGQSRMVEQKVRDLLLSSELIECTQLDGCFATEVEDPYRLLFGRDSTTERVYHYVRELDDRILSWNDRTTDRSYEGENGYFLWLLLGSLALVAPLADVAYCKSILQGHDRVYLLSGFESLYSYLATVTPGGIRYEENASRSCCGEGQARVE
jgi:hypothetical protein